MPRACPSVASAAVVESVIAIGLCALALGCHSGRPAAASAMEGIGTSGGAPVVAGAESGVAYAFDSLDARPVTSAAMRGRPTVLAFVATWDLSSQAQIDFIVPMSEKRDDVTYVMVALQEPKDRELVEAFAASLKVRFPVALADRDTIGGGGPFGDVHNVPTVIVLGRDGRVVWRHVGLARSAELRTALRGL